MDNSTNTSGSRGVWADDEHERFLEALHIYPDGPWKAVAEFVGTRTVRQVQTHAQKYHEKAARRLRDLRQFRDRGAVVEPSIDLEMMQICEALKRNRVPLSPRSTRRQQSTLEVFAEASYQCFGELSPTAQGSDSDDLPSLDECLDFLIGALGSHAESNERNS